MGDLLAFGLRLEIGRDDHRPRRPMQLPCGVGLDPRKHIHTIGRNPHDDFRHRSRTGDETLLRVEIDRLLIGLDRFVRAS